MPQFGESVPYAILTESARVVEPASRFGRAVEIEHFAVLEIKWHEPLEDDSGIHAVFGQVLRRQQVHDGRQLELDGERRVIFPRVAHVPLRGQVDLLVLFRRGRGWAEARKHRSLRVGRVDLRAGGIAVVLLVIAFFLVLLVLIDLDVKCAAGEGSGAVKQPRLAEL